MGDHNLSTKMPDRTLFLFSVPLQKMSKSDEAFTLKINIYTKLFNFFFKFTSFYFIEQSYDKNKKKIIHIYINRLSKEMDEITLILKNNCKFGHLFNFQN